MKSPQIVQEKRSSESSTAIIYAIKYTTALKGGKYFIVMLFALFRSRECRIYRICRNAMERFVISLS